jgi:hypothetical protein
VNTIIRHQNHNSNRLTRKRRTIMAAVAVVASLAAAGCASSPQQSAAADPAALVNSDLVPGQAVPGDATTDGGPWTTAPGIEPAAGDATLPPNTDADSDPTGDAAEDANDLLDDSGDQGPELPPAPQVEPPADADDDGPLDLDPVEPAQPPAPHPCDSLVADGSSLVVGPDPLVLDKGDLDGTITIVNCSDGDIDWTAKTKPSVSLDDDGANLLPGEFAELDFVIDSAQWDPGAVDFKIRVSEPGHNHYVDVHAFRQLVGKDVVADVGLTAGPGAGGCANQCIVSALLAPNFTTPNLSIDITTNTAASIRTWVSKNAPVEIDGVPTFVGVQPIDVSPAGVTTHHGLLTPLTAGTKYHIVVGATDQYDHTSYRTGSFTTITPVDNPGDFVLPGDPPGCSAQCITKAQITAGADHTSKNISIASHTAARLQVFVSTEAPTWSNGVPSFAATDFWEPSGLEYVTSWDTTIVGLSASTDYHIIVRATDANDHDDYQVGQFHTAAAPTYDVVFTVLGIDVGYDGDKGANRGEMSFRWAVGNDHAGSKGESKVSSGDWVTFARPVSTFVAYGVTDWLPGVRIAALERDADGKVEFCTAGNGTPIDAGSNGDCDVVWSVATGGIVSLDSLTGYPLCTALGFDPVYADQHCLTLTTFGTPSGYPEITGYVAVQVND